MTNKLNARDAAMSINIWFYFPLMPTKQKHSETFCVSFIYLVACMSFNHIYQYQHMLRNFTEQITPQADNKFISVEKKQALHTAAKTINV